MKNGSSSTKVLHVPTTVGGHPQGIARAERKLGLESWSVTLRQNYYNFDVDEILWSEGQHFVSKELKRLLFISRAAKEFDIVHYNFGKTIADPSFSDDGSITDRYPSMLIRLYCEYSKLLQKYEFWKITSSHVPIFITYQGDDARQGDFSLKNFPITFAKEVEEGYYSESSDKEKRKRIRMMDKVANKIYSVNPDLLHVLPERTQFLPYAHIDPMEWKPFPPSNSRPLVLHAPSHRLVKGTKYVIRAVERLKNEGIAFDFQLIEDVSNVEAMKLYKDADILVDQLLAGWYGGLAVELMAMGKPVISYIRREDLHFIPEAMRNQLPIIHATPDSVYDVLKSTLNMPLSYLRRQGERSRAYVEQWHDPMKIAKRLKGDYLKALKTRN